ncbi:MAG: serine/threonine-protein phosphatase [Anaerolineales bacterium]|nr:serine/threonine-protein phosphatase [Anaerolineales bacterium]
MKEFIIKSSILSDNGRTRTHNQDTIRICEPADPETVEQYGNLYIVADGAGGVGGANAGAVASRYSANKVQQLYYRSSHAKVGYRLKEAMLAANNAIKKHAVKPGRIKSMATTMVAAVIRGEKLTVANVGDSRGYLLRNNEIIQITEDHSLVAGLLADGVITAEEAAGHPQRNVILHSLGTANRPPRIDIFEHKLKTDDIILLCSDGLTRYTTKENLLSLLKGPIDRAAQRLVDFANTSGGADNISVAVIRVTTRHKKFVPSRLGWWFLLFAGIALILLSGLVVVMTR